MTEWLPGRTSRLLYALLLLTIVTIGATAILVEAQPEVLPESTYTGPLATGSECIILDLAGVIDPTITAPNGSTLRVFGFVDGVCLNGTVLDATPAGAAVVIGDLTGTPLNGTFTFRHEGNPGFSTSCILTSTSGWNHVFRDEHQRPNAYSGLWNYHLGSHDEGTATCPDPDVDPEEDPDNARYYRPDGPSGDRAPQAFTGNSTVTAFDRMNITGSWVFNATGDDTFTWFQYADGNHTGQPDLSVLPNAQSTPDENQGDAFTGNTSATIAYNNNAGTSYQFCARNSLGSSCGVTLFQPSGQGDAFQPGTPPVGGQDQVIADFRLSVSHAQCDGDSIAFSLFLNDALGPTDTMNVTIYDTRDGSIELLIDSTQMVEFGETIWLLNRTMVTGTYAALGYLDRGGPIAQDRIWLESFNVPRGSCDPDDLLGQHAATQAAIANLNVNINGTRIEAIAQNLTEHRDASLEVNRMDYGTLEFGPFMVLLLYLLILGVSLWHGWLIVALAPTLAFPGLWMDPYPISFTTFVFLFILTLWLQYLSHGGYFTALKERLRGESEA